MKNILGVFVFIVAFSQDVYCKNSFINDYYFGVDYLYAITNFKKDFGGNILSKKCEPGFNLFFGYALNSNLGIEFGAEFYKNIKKTVIQIDEGTMVAGVPIPSRNQPGEPPNWESYKTMLMQKGLYGGVASRTNINKNTLISLLVGLSLYKIKVQYNIFDDEHNDGQIEEPFIRNFAKSKLIPIAKIMIEHKINANIGIRALATYKHTSLFKMKSLENPSSDAQVKAKNTFGFGVGAIYYI